MYSTLRYEVADGILTITLNRPDVLNAFTVEMADELEDAFDQANEDDAVRAVVMTGSGRAFCAGMDLRSPGNVFGLDEQLTPTLEDMAARLHESPVADGVRDTGGRVTLAIYESTKPVVAAINGPAVGVGATMTLAMDARLASSTARVGLVFGQLGIVPEAASTWFLPRIVGIPKALELTFTSEIMSAHEAEAAGLIRSVHDPDDLLPAAYSLARKFTRDKSAVATALTRQMMYRNSAQPHPIEAHRVDSLAMFYTSVGDGKEGVRAMLEKRAPSFTSSASRMPPFFPWQ